MNWRDVVTWLWCIVWSVGIAASAWSVYLFRDAVEVAKASGVNGARLRWRREAGHLGMVEATLLGAACMLKVAAGVLALIDTSSTIIIGLICAGGILVVAAIVYPTYRRARFIREG